MTHLPKHDRLDVWCDGSAICIIAVAANGDPLDLGEHEAEAFLRKLQDCIDQVKGQ
jgi:hypothetical protein